MALRGYYPSCLEDDMSSDYEDARFYAAYENEIASAASAGKFVICPHCQSHARFIGVSGTHYVYYCQRCDCEIDA
jgi:hypothetical protein